MTYLLSIEEINEELDRDNFKAYYLVSTAQRNVESTVSDDKDYHPPLSFDEPDRKKHKPSEKIGEIVQYIMDAKTNNPDVNINIVVQIHGYNTGDSYKDNYTKAQEEIKKIQERNNSSDNNIVIFFGYAWPSEKIALFNLQFINESLNSLPGILLIFSVIGLGWIGAGVIWILRNIFPGINIFTEEILESISEKLMQSFIGDIVNFIDSYAPIIIWIANAILYSTVISSAITVLTTILILLRASVYFRDSYRATNYGVPDLVQFFRAFEYLLIHKQTSIKFDPNHKLNQTDRVDRYRKFYENNRIKLSFIGHSMGGFVTTNLVRTLSDVFDSLDPGISNTDELDDDDALSIIDGERIISKQKRSNIGKCFSLERLILVSPDIPVNAIMSGRSNFLSSSLSRFQESFLFSNEGDMVLLLLSTVANYISFPSTTSQMGYKLGNLGVDNYMDSIDQYKTSWFHHVDRQQDDTLIVGNVLGNLIIGIEHGNLIKAGKNIPFVAQEFTYFDCTNYLRSELSLLNTSEQQVRNYKKLRYQDYFSLVFKLSGSHGGYFMFDDTKEAIYTIASKGFKYFEETVTGETILSDAHPIKVLRPEKD